MKQEEALHNATRYAVVDVEAGFKDKRIHDIGAWKWDGATLHTADKRRLTEFLGEVNYVCGHNIIRHDAKYLFGEGKYRWILVDTLYVSPLLFPERPYHRLLKDDKLVSEQMNNPVNDCEKARDLLMDEVAAGSHGPIPRKRQWLHCCTMCPNLPAFWSLSMLRQTTRPRYRKPSVRNTREESVSTQT